MSPLWPGFVSSSASPQAMRTSGGVSLFLPAFLGGGRGHLPGKAEYTRLWAFYGRASMDRVGKAIREVDPDHYLMVGQQQVKVK